jgi:hypothetical protein
MSGDLDDLCVYCGAPSPTTRDHIPPKGIFPTPRPGNLITVPSCAACNHGASASDEAFRAYLSLHVGIDTSSTSRLWSQAALPGIRRNWPLLRRLLDETERVWLAAPSGVIHSQAYRLRWDSTAHDATIERMIRGLYFHHYGDVLGVRVRIEVRWFRALDANLLEATEGCEQRSIGGDQFVYRFGRASDAPLHSVWLFEFHKRHWAGGQTAPVERDDEHPADSGGSG